LQALKDDVVGTFCLQEEPVIVIRRLPTTTLIRFLALVNSKIFNNSYISSSSENGVCSSGISRSRPQKMYPTSAASCTKAASSGDCTLYSILFISGSTTVRKVWHSDSTGKKH
jgi:hypothetical protein